ncbi:MAG: hypothetical protein M0Q13_03325 [Methanothrix sp.]|nr:hypothetical protein [Methanothrix sp.]
MTDGSRSSTDSGDARTPGWPDQWMCLRLSESAAMSGADRKTIGDRVSLAC